MHAMRWDAMLAMLPCTMRLSAACASVHTQCSVVSTVYVTTHQMLADDRACDDRSVVLCYSASRSLSSSLAGCYACMLRISGRSCGYVLHDLMRALIMRVIDARASISRYMFLPSLMHV